MILNHDPKFLLDLWTVLLERLDIKFFYSTAYHPQTDRASKHTNQIAEIAFCFYFYTIEKFEQWPKVLLLIQALINNSQSAITTKTFNKIALGFTPNRFLDLLIRESTINSITIWIDAKDAILFTQTNFKHYYD